MKLRDVEVGQRVVYRFLDSPPRPGVITVDRRPGGMVSAQLDDGQEVTTLPDWFELDASAQ